MKQVRPNLFSVLSIALIPFFSTAPAQAANHYRPARPISYQVVDQAPVVIGGGRAPAAAQPAPYAQQPLPTAQQPSYAQQPAPYGQRVPQAAQASAPAPSAAMEPIVEGFADRIPINVAMQQILPPGYSYTLGAGVDPGQLVSWRGGRPWNAVLQDMVGSSGLTYGVNGRSVMVSPAGGAAPMIVSNDAPMPPPSSMPPLQDQAMIMPPVAPQPMTAPQPLMPPQYASPQYAQPYAVQQPVMQPMPQYAPQPMDQQAVAMQQQPMMVPQPQPMMQPAPQMVPQPMPPQAMAPQGANAIPVPQPLQIENPQLFVPQVWEAKPGQTLRALLQDWCGRAGAELDWSAEYDYPIMASLNINGTFEEAVRTLLSGFSSVTPTPRGRLHYNPAAGQSVLIVEATGNHYGE